MQKRTPARRMADLPSPILALRCLPDLAGIAHICLHMLPHPFLYSEKRQPESTSNVRESMPVVRFQSCYRSFSLLSRQQTYLHMAPCQATGLSDGVRLTACPSHSKRPAGQGNQAAIAATVRGTRTSINRYSSGWTCDKKHVRTAALRGADLVICCRTKVHTQRGYNTSHLSADWIRP